MSGRALGGAAHGRQATGWDRPEVNVRLTTRRLAMLKALADRLPHSATPTDAIDHALAAALEGTRGIDQRLDDMEDAAERRDMERRFEIDRVEESLIRMAESLDALRSLLTDAAQGDDF